VAAPSQDGQDWSDLTCHNEGGTADGNNTRSMVRTQPMPINEADLSRLGSQEGTAAHVAPEEGSDAVGLHISEDTPEDQPTPLSSHIIINKFRNGNYEDLMNTGDPAVVIDALSSNISVMRSLVAPINDSGDGRSMEPHDGHTEED
jgi:hypothetical protein